MPIPRVIHQLWKDHAVPARFAHLRQSWPTLHPDWEMRLWTDRDLKELVERDFPELADVYRGYADNICRADLGRYLVLRRHGGVYADLDCECLRPVGPLLEGAGFVIGAEPASHDAYADVEARGLSRLLCPSFIASTADHEVWPVILAGLVEARGAKPLDATGPYLLTRLLTDHPVMAGARVLAPEVLYPVDKQDCWTGKVHDIEFREAATREAYVLHEWHGGWHRPQAVDRGLPIEISARLTEGRFAAATFPPDGPPPAISCLMEASGEPAAARRAIDGFLAQTHPDKELIVATGDAVLRDWIAGLAVAHVRPASSPAAAARLAAAPLIAMWDERDLQDPMRLEIQCRVLRRTGAEACLVGRWIDWSVADRRLGVVGDRPLESSLLCRRSAFPPRGAPSVDQLLAERRVAIFDLSRLCVRTHPTDAGGSEPLVARYEGERYEAVLTELAKRLPIEALRRHPAPPGRRRAATPPAGLDMRLFGHFSASLGHGVAARGMAAALSAAGAPAALFDVPLTESHPPPPAPPGRSEPALAGAPRIDIVHVNPDLLAQARDDGRFAFAPRRPGLRTIGVFAWEAETGVPAPWRSILPLFDEIWAPSAHAAAAFRKAAPAHVEVAVIPHAVAPPEPVFDRASLGLPPDAFVFLFTFDAASLVERKNPAGVIQAYRAAFPTPRRDVRLVVKARKLTGPQLDALNRLAVGRDDIALVNAPWSDARQASLMAACDCYVSLHRAEGFGLGMAEAMFYGKPVIATAYSGNLDFMSPATAFLAPFTLTTLRADVGPFAAGAVWAEPDLAGAARLMAAVESDRKGAAAVGARAARWVRRRLSPAAVGRRLRERLERAAAPAAPRRRRPPRADASVLVLTPVKDAADRLPRYFELLAGLAHDPRRLSLAFLESDSCDGSGEALASAVAELQGGVARAELHRRDYGYRPPGPRWAPAIQRQRREILARARNRLQQAALRDEDWVLWLDADLVDYPPDLLARLLAAGREIVAAHCVWPDGRTFDLNTFRFADAAAAEDPCHLIDGLYQPPRGAGRLYLDAFEGEAPVRVDSVGGTALLVRADLHREGLMFPPFPYRGYIETEGLAMMARDMGRECWAIPSLRVVHFDG